MPIFKFPPKIPDISPANVGPPEPPRSPDKASIANRAVPPFLIVEVALLKVPGQRIPTENPHIAQPARFTQGIGTKAMRR